MALTGQGTPYYAAAVIDGVTVDDNAAAYSSGIDTREFRDKTLAISLAVAAGAPTDIDIWVEDSHDNTTWFGANSATEGVRMIDSNGNTVTVYTMTGAAEETLGVPDYAAYTRVGYQGSGCSGAANWTLSVALMAR